MKTTFNILASVVALRFAVGCASDSDPGGASVPEITEAEARSKASVAAPNATVGTVSKIDEGAERRWKLEVVMPNGAPLTVELERSNGDVAEIAGSTAPFDYELPAPAPGLLTYAEAKAKALAAKSGGVELWEVQPAKHLYEFYVRESGGTLWEIKMEATKGDITTVEEKSKPD